MNILRLVPEHGGEPIVIDLDFVLIGRDASSDIHLRDASVSRRHAEIRRENDEWMIFDLGSGNGVFVEGARTPSAQLLPGQRLQLGNVRFRVEIDRGDDGNTMIFGRSPLASGSSATMLGAPPGFSVPARATSPRSGGLPILGVAVIGLAMTSLVILGAMYYWSLRQKAVPASRAASTRVTPFPTATPVPSVTPLPTPAPTPPRVVLPKAALLISTDIAAVVFLDGRRMATVPARGLWRAQVSPGEHVVGFEADGARHDQLVRINANEQAVVRFPGSGNPAPSSSPTPLTTTSPIASSPPTSTPSQAVRPVVATQSSPAATATPQTLFSFRPTPPPVSSPASNTASTPLSALPNASSVQPALDEGVTSGAAAAARGDFYRAVLVLKDAIARLEKSSRTGKELARAHANLVWAYQALNRPDDAQAEVGKALKADPGIVVSPDAFPPGVVNLFKRPR